MRLRPCVLLLGSCVVTGLPAQGVVNPSILRAPADDAASQAVRRTATMAAVERSRAAVVHVFVEVDGPRGTFPIERASSGVCVDPSGLVVTFGHLVREAQGAADKRLIVQLDDAENTRLPASIVRIDDGTGLALLAVTPGPRGLVSLQLGADAATTGEPLVTLGCPAGKDMFGFAGVATRALADVVLGGRSFARQQVFLTDARNDERCDGGAVVDGEGRLVGLFAAEHVQRDRSEPTLEELRQPSFGVVVPAGTLRSAFEKEFAGAERTNASLRKAPAAGAVPALAAAVQRVAPAVVGVWSGDGEWPQPSANDPGGVQRRAGVGSGVVLGKRGLVATNAHVCRNGSAKVRTADGSTFQALVVKQQGDTNLALLRVELPAGTTLAVADCNPDDDAILGETVLAVGRPFGTEVVVSAGVVSAVRKREGGRIQADANLGSQNGGGAVVDATGRLLGIGDAGAVDPLEMQFAMRGDRVTTETNLSTFVGIARVRRVFQKELEADAAADEPIRTPAAVPAAERARRQSALTAMVAKASGAMLNIYVARNVAAANPDDPFASMQKPDLVPLSLGSGVIVDRSGLAISNWHVVDDATNPDGSMRADHVVTAGVFGGKTYPVRVLSISREDDLSLLQLELAPGEEVQAVELGNSDALQIGENVAAIGNPHGRANTITFGVVAAKEQELRVKGRWAKLEHLIETDAAINGGNSGGALLDMNGRLVGINSAGGGTFNNRGFAISVDHVRKQLLGLLLAAYKLRSADLGLRVLDDDGTVIVLDVDERGPAAKAGVRSGDRILELAGVPITWSPGFARQLGKAAPGEPLPLVVDRKGEKKSFTLLPLSAPIWAVIRQAGLQCRDFPFAENPDRVRQACIAMHRQITGDPAGEPVQIPESVVVVDRIFAPETAAGLAEGDFVLAVELRSAANGGDVFVRVEDVVRLRDLFNDRELGTYEGAKWKVWIAHGTAVRAVEIVGKRLFW